MRRTAGNGSSPAARKGPYPEKRRPLRPRLLIFFKKFSRRLKRFDLSDPYIFGGKNMLNKFISPLADFLVKDVFGNQKTIENTAGFLKAVLGLDPAECRSLRIVDPHLHRRWRKDKLGVVDIRINTASGKVFHVEVQVASEVDFIPRSMYYQDRQIVDQLGSGDPYGKINRTVTISILNYILLKDEPPDRYKNVYRFLNTVSHKAFTDLQELVILELPKAPEKDDGTAVWPWLKYFKCKTMEELEMLARKHPEVAGAVRQVRRNSPIRAIRELIFEYEDARRIRMGRDRYAREQGYQEAKAEDHEQIRQSLEQNRQDQEHIRQLEEENRRLRGNS
jgi:predicted transposase/invertase (TIGR01784 family)